MRKLTTSELNRLSVVQFRDRVKAPIVIVLDNIRSQQNTGSVFRTADAFRLEAVWLCGITATPPHREIHRAALGATDSVEWKYFTTTAEAVSKLRSEGYFVIGIEQTDQSVFLSGFGPPANRKYALVFGNEVAGLSEEVLPLLDACVEIPQFGTKHSFNVAVSAGIVIWDLFVKTNFAGPVT
jgi:23S rRNA (guanosine2251-2'-O)-methyltransferase